MVQTFLNTVASALSVTPVCPRCKRVIPSEDINVAKDIAFCRSCDLSHELSALMTGTVIDADVDLSRPPEGTWFQRDSTGPVVGASHRSPGQATGLLMICLFWNIIVSVFVLLVLASTLQHLGIPVPHWFPAPASKNGLMPVGMTLFMWLFLTPFIAIGLAMAAAFLSSLAGRTELRIQGSQAVLFSGIGSLGFRKRFGVSDIKSVRVEDKRWRDSDGDSRRRTQIIIETSNAKPITFGSMLTQERRNFVAAAVKKMLNV